MLYYLSVLGEQMEAWSFLRLFRYTTFRAGGAGFTAFLVVTLAGPMTVRLLRQARMFSGGRAEAYDPSLGDPAKGKVPLMGGLLILSGIFSAILTWAKLDVSLVWVFLFVMVSLGVLGFVDDFQKVRGREARKGMSARTKLLWQLLVAGAAVWLLDKAPETRGIIRDLLVPFYKQPLLVGLPLALVVAFGAMVVVGSSNAVNLTDGLDGLASGAMVTASLAMGAFAYLCGHAKFSAYLEIPYIPNSNEVLVIAAAMAGACLGFLWHNCYPASMFMGDTGSLALGGALGLMAVLVRQELVLVLVGGVFVAEALSVMLQVSYFKLTRKLTGEGRRIFQMAPIHHHFQRTGWRETQVVVRFWIVGLLCAVLGLATLKLR